MGKRMRIGLILVAALLLAAGAGYLVYSRLLAPAQVSEEPALETAPVSRGDIVITVDGSGSLTPSAEVELSFGGSGVVAELLVAVGDRVQAGDVLARLDDGAARRQLAEAELSLEQAEAQLSSARVAAGTSSDNLLSSRIELEQAQSAVEAAQEAYREAMDPARDWELYRRGANLESEREAAEDALWRAQQDLELAQASYDLTREGAWNDLQAAGWELEAAQLALEAAQQDLEDTVLLAPIDGTVMSIGADVGEASASPMVTLADLASPLICFWVEETDMSAVAVGSAINVVFEALPDETFVGQITRVDPALETVDNTLAVQVWATLEGGESPVRFLSGMTVEVEVIAGEARDVLLVPLQALREIGEDQYAVFIVRPDGELEMRQVEVGLQDYVNAEVRSGLEPGETVSLGVAEESSGATAPEGQEFQPPMGLFLGGGG